MDGTQALIAGTVLVAIGLVAWLVPGDHDVEEDARTLWRFHQKYGGAAAVVMGAILIVLGAT